MNVIYLASGRAKLAYPFVTYNDIKEPRDIVCDMMLVDLSNYDILIATPPCNFYSRANYRRFSSDYAMSTRHLLPDIIDKFLKTGKPFIVENVRNSQLFKDNGLFDKNCFVYVHGRHTYWTNVFINFSSIPQHYEFKAGGVRLSSYVQGGTNVNSVFDYFIDVVLDRLQLNKSCKSLINI